jgi:hypothetical protein
MLNMEEDDRRLFDRRWRERRLQDLRVAEERRERERRQHERRTEEDGHSHEMALNEELERLLGGEPASGVRPEQEEKEQ